ncbi:MAG TPA: glycerophosphodiester phosphodiesterase [Gaiellaceae bacterium]|nr:glycerophosphodiester phosphodiesterase [Gaiellaceae bacterium]
MIGHRGAAKVAPENSLEGLEAAVAAGADLVEFDVERSTAGSALAIGHPGVSRVGPAPTLEEALAYLAGQEIGIHVDLKLAGAEDEIAAALRRHGVEHRTVVSTPDARSLRSLGELAPELGRAISYPEDRLGAASIPWPRTVVRTSAAGLRFAMRARVPLLLAASGGNALSLHHAIVSAAVVRTAHSRGAGVIAWTVNDPVRVRVLALMGVDAIVSDDPQMIASVLATLNTRKPDTQNPGQTT